MNVGEIHKVPCAIVPRGNKAPWVIPIYDNLHDDRENDQNYQHYHADTRFIHGKHLAKTGFPLRIPGGTVIKIYKRRLQRRNEMYHTHPSLIEKSPLNWDNVKEGKCPHKGYDLSDEVPDCNGVVTCPLHGLKVKLKRHEDI